MSGSGKQTTTSEHEELRKVRTHSSPLYALAGA
jgi:hypothetical protein